MTRAPPPTPPPNQHLPVLPRERRLQSWEPNLSFRHPCRHASNLSGSHRITAALCKSAFGAPHARRTAQIPSSILPNAHASVLLTHPSLSALHSCQPGVTAAQMPSSILPNAHASVLLTHPSLSALHSCQPGVTAAQMPSSILPNAHASVLLTHPSLCALHSCQPGVSTVISQPKRSMSLPP